VATTKRALPRSERFAPRAEAEVELYRRECIRSSQLYAPQRAIVWYGPGIARWIAEREPTVAASASAKGAPASAAGTAAGAVDAQTGRAGGVLALQPFVDERWLSHELLRFGGEALPLSPPTAVAGLGELVGRLLERYA
jgi:hypothetical protein